jgi:hypothetical protein
MSERAVNMINVTYNAFDQVALGGEREGDVRNKILLLPLGPDRGTDQHRRVALHNIAAGDDDDEA